MQQRNNLAKTKNQFDVSVERQRGWKNKEKILGISVDERRQHS